MSVQWKTWSVLVVGAALMAVGCGPSDRTQSAQSVPEGSATPTFCGGVGGIQCPEGQACVDDPSDDCDPKNGGADCGGICVSPSDSPAPTEQSTCGSEPGYHYVLRDPVKCQGVRFKCEAGEVAFFNDCGCGCKPAS